MVVGSAVVGFGVAVVSLAWLCYGRLLLGVGVGVGLALAGHGTAMVDNGWLGLALLWSLLRLALLWSARERIMAYSHGVVGGSRM
jgi:hypothetical protein